MPFLTFKPPSGTIIKSLTWFCFVVICFVTLFTKFQGFDWPLGYTKNF